MCTCMTQLRVCQCLPTFMDAEPAGGTKTLTPELPTTRWCARLHAYAVAAARPSVSNCVRASERASVCVCERECV